MEYNHYGRDIVPGCVVKFSEESERGSMVSTLTVKDVSGELYLEGLYGSTLPLGRIFNVGRYASEYGVNVRIIDITWPKFDMKEPKRPGSIIVLFDNDLIIQYISRGLGSWMEYREGLLISSYGMGFGEVLNLIDANIEDRPDMKIVVIPDDE